MYAIAIRDLLRSWSLDRTPLRVAGASGSEHEDRSADLDERVHVARLAVGEPHAPVRRRVRGDVRVLVHRDPAYEVRRVGHPDVERLRPGEELLAVDVEGPGRGPSE